MRKLLSFVIVVALAAMMPICASAKSVDLFPSGKTVIATDDWMYEKINNDTQCELDEYVGSDGVVYAPRFFGDCLVVRIGNHCFANNSNVTKVFTSSPMWTIGEYAFINCTSLECFECNYALNKIESGAFSGTSALKEINLEDSIVSEISPYSFLNSGIEEIVLPDTCTKIGDYGFGQCSSLTKITIPDSVTEISDIAFAGNDGMTIACRYNFYAYTYALEHNFNVEFVDPQYGDVNGDGVVNILDVTFIQKYKVDMISLSQYGLVCADVNHDNDITIRDATFIQMYLAGLETII